MFGQFHFLEPLWFLALLPLALLWWLISRASSGDAKAWEKVIDANLLPLLLGSSNNQLHKRSSFGKWLLALGWLITTVALADPVWEKIPRPIFQTNASRIIVLDLSSSMLINDLKPSRLARARFKIEDILSNQFAKKEEGQLGLVLFAGDAFTASPLTRDSETIRSLLEVLTPNIMPSQGSRVDLGLQKAYELLKQAGVENGQVLLIADGVSDQAATLKVVSQLNKSGHSLSVLGVGTEAGGVLPQLKYRDGKSIKVKLDSKNLQEIAAKGGGKYHLISTNNTDLKSVLARSFISNEQPEKSAERESEDWKSTGPILILLLLPLAALAFRRGWLFSILVSVSLIGILQPQPLMAAPLTGADALKSSWDNLWSNKEQQAEKALHDENYDKATTLSKKPLIRGFANYKTEKYQQALDDFKQAKGADARYNEGNALAKLEKYKEAIEAYDKALKQQPKMQDALQNKAAIEKLLKQKKHEKSDESKGDNENKEDQPNKEGEGKESKDEKNDSKDGKQSESDKPAKEGDKKSEDGKNQFSKANKELDENKDSKDKDGKESTDEKDDKSAKKEDKENAVEKNESKEKTDKKGTKTEAKELTKEEKMAAEQWLRRIPDDPGGLLRRKFQRQYQQRRSLTKDNDQPW